MWYHLLRRNSPLTIALACVLLLGACSSGAGTEVPAVEAPPVDTADEPSVEGESSPELVVLVTALEREVESGQFESMRGLPVGDERVLGSDDGVSVDSSGRASLGVWYEGDADVAAGEPVTDDGATDSEPAFELTGDLMGDTELMTISALVDPDWINFGLYDGISRYGLTTGREDSLMLTVNLGPNGAKLTSTTDTGEAADFAVCFVQRTDGQAADTKGSDRADASAGDGDPVVWVAILEGTVRLEVRASTDPNGTTMTGLPLAAGDIAVVTEAGHILMPEPMAVEEIEEWYSGAIDGKRECLGVKLPTLAGRTATAEAARTAEVQLTADAELTQEAMVTSSVPGGSLTADRTRLAYGECTDLHWLVTNAMLATLDGEAVALSGAREVCPPATATYTLRWSGYTGSSGETSVTIEVEGAPTQEPGDDGDEVERPTDEPSIPGSETPCTPCAKPTRRPSATNPPAPSQPLPTEPAEPPTEPPPTELPPSAAPPTEPPVTEPPPETEVP